MRRWRAWVPALMLAALAALTWWLDQKVQPVSPKDAPSRSDPDFVVDNFEATRLNEQGIERYGIVAKKMVHYPGDNSAVLDQPVLTHFDPESAPVSIRANQGMLENNGENAYFTGDVQIHRAAYADNAEMALYTTFLHVIPDQDLVKTDREVTMVSGNSTVKAVGLEFDNRKREVKLLSNVKGQLETPVKSRHAMPWDRRKR